MNPNVHNTDMHPGAAKRTAPDNLTGALGAHPKSTGIGALVGGATAGAAAGTVAGPVGALFGAAVGALAGGLTGKGVAEVIEPTGDSTYWRKNFSQRDYVDKGSSFDDYGPAYGFGATARRQYAGRDFEEIETELAGDWHNWRGDSRLGWDQARLAVREAWDRITD